jgi:hypothetical protein
MRDDYLWESALPSNNEQSIAIEKAGTKTAGLITGSVRDHKIATYDAPTANASTRIMMAAMLGLVGNASCEFNVERSRLRACSIC